MFNIETDKQGVSPVIGVILMVAITVILAAVIGTFVLDLAGNVEQNAQASVTFDHDATAETVTVQAVSMQNADLITVKSDSGSATYTTDKTISNVGEDVVVEDSGASGTITVTATLEDNTTVIQTEDYDFTA